MVDLHTQKINQEVKLNRLNLHIATLFSVILTIFLSLPAEAQEIANRQRINFIYQLDDYDSFEIKIDARRHDCGSTFYKIKHDNAIVLERKFSMTMSALLAHREITFKEEGVCEGNRMMVGWIRIHD